MSYQDGYLSTLAEMLAEEEDTLRRAALRWVIGEYAIYQSMIDDVHRFLDESKAP